MKRNQDNDMIIIKAMLGVLELVKEQKDERMIIGVLNYQNKYADKQDKASKWVGIPKVIGLESNQYSQIYFNVAIVYSI